MWVIAPSVDLFEFFFPQATIRTNPIVGKVIEGSPGFNACERVSFFRIVEIPTSDAFIR